MSEKRTIKVAILDLYEGVENQGMRCIRELLNQFSESSDIELVWDEFEVRISHNLPGLEYDIFISSGGSGCSGHQGRSRSGKTYPRSLGRPYLARRPARRGASS